MDRRAFISGITFGLVATSLAAELIDKILKGAKPADLPVEQRTITQSLLLRADEVIQ